MYSKLMNLFSRILTLLCLLFFCGISSGRAQGNYRTILTHELNKIQAPLQEQKEVLIFLYNKAECASCNAITGLAMNDVKILKRIPVQNRIVLSFDIRPVEMPLYQQRFKAMGRSVAILINKPLYHALCSYLDRQTGYGGGFVVLDRAGKVTRVFNLKDPAIIEKLRLAE